MIFLENIRHSILLNLSNQANTIKCTKTHLAQYNFFVIIGLEYLNSFNESEKIPISFYIDKDGNLSINGLDEDKLNNENIYIYSDKKVTSSE